MAEGFLGLPRVFTRSHRPIHSQLLIGKEPPSFIHAVANVRQHLPGGALAASGMAWRTAATISRISCQSSVLRLPGSVCSIVSSTSGPISLAQVAKKTPG